MTRSAETDLVDPARMTQVAQPRTVPPQSLDAEESVLGAMMLVARRDRRRQRDPRGRRLLPGEPRDGSTGPRSRCTRRASRSMRSRSSTSSRSAASSRTSAAGRASTSSPRSSRPRPTPAHYARIVREAATLRGLIRAGGEIARLGWDGVGEPVELVDRAEQIVFDLSQQRVHGDFTHIEQLLKESFERITALYESGADVTGLPVRVPRPRPAHLRLPARQPHHRRSAPEHGQVGLRAVRRREPRRAPPRRRSPCSRSRCRRRRSPSG